MKNGKLIEFGNAKEIILNPIHEYTIELLLNYFQYYYDISITNHSANDISDSNFTNIIMISETHYVRGKHSTSNNFETLKEKIYENLRTEKLKYLSPEIS